MWLAVDVHRLWLVAIPKERRLRHVILGDVVFQTREGYLLLAGGVGTWDRPAHFDKVQSHNAKENSFLSEALHFPEQAVDFVRADDIQTVGRELAATDDISALFWEVEFRDFGLGRFIPLGWPCICNSAMIICIVRRHNFTGAFWRMQNE